MNSRRLPAVVEELREASERELSAQGIAMPYFRRWLSAAESGKVDGSVEGALVALEYELGAAPEDPRKWSALSPWVERLRGERAASQD